VTHALVAMLIAFAGPHHIEDWFDYWGIDMPAPLNWNLDKIALPTQATTKLSRKVIWIGDSQSEQSVERMGGQIPENIDAPITGLMAYNINQQSVGIHANAFDITGPPSTTSVSVEPGSAWPGGASSGFHLGYSRSILVSGGDLSNNTEVHSVGLTNASGFTGTLDLDSEWSAIVAYVNDSASWVGVGLQEFRNTTDGNTVNVGNGGGAGDADGNFDRAGGLDLITASDGSGTIEASIRAAGAGGFGSEGDEPVGINFITRGTSGDEEDLYLQIVGTYFKNAAAGSYPSGGLQFIPIFQGGYSADDHLDEIDNAARLAAVQAINGADLVVIMLGHNPENSGTRADNIEQLANNMITRHTGAGFAEPDILVIAPWQSDGAGSWTESEANSIYTKCRQNGWGFINLWRYYGGDSPGALDGYTMDGSDIHPGNAATANLIAEDIIGVMTDESGWVTGGQRSRTRSRDR